MGGRVAAPSGPTREMFGEADMEVAHETDRQSRCSGRRVAHGCGARSTATRPAEAGIRASTDAGWDVPDDDGRRHDGREWDDARRNDGHDGIAERLAADDADARRDDEGDGRSHAEVREDDGERPALAR